MIANLHDISWGTRQNKDQEGGKKKKKDMGIIGGIVNGVCGMCLGEASCKECCCNEDSDDGYDQEYISNDHASTVDQPITHTLNLYPKKTVKVMSNNEDSSSEDEHINEGSWFEDLHKLRRHSDSQDIKNDKDAVKKRYTTAEFGVTTKSKGHYYKNPNFRNNEFRKLSADDLKFTQVPVKQQSMSNTTQRRITKLNSSSTISKIPEFRKSEINDNRYTSSRSTGLTRNSGMSINSQSSLRRSLVKKNKTFISKNLDIFQQLKKQNIVDIDDSGRDNEFIKKNYVNFGGTSLKTLRKLYNLISSTPMHQPRDMSLLLEYLTYPTAHKVFLNRQLSSYTEVR
jgi:hypothetical protein